MGDNFVDGATLKVGGVPATHVVVVSSTKVTGKTPALAAGTLDDVRVINPGNIWGALADGWFADFKDVPQSNPFHPDVETIFRDGVTGGCGNGLYCPLVAVSRDQMAVLILRASLGANYQPPPATGTVFADVPADAFAAAWIEDLYARGITAGCATNPLRYCPDQTVKRRQMSVMLLRAEHGSTYTPPACTGVFTDVGCPGTYANWIEQLAAEGITAGCGNGKFCPGQITKRQQMATFLVRTFELDAQGLLPMPRPRAVGLRGLEP
jgi:hypothetical protein